MQSETFLRRNSSLTMMFSCVGHSYAHIFTMMYLTVVLALEREWGMGYAELIRLSTLGALLFGAGALPMGWICDRWNAVGMMVLFFLCTGLASVATGFARNPTEMMLGLAAIGLAASIYHPVGIAWVVRTSARHGRALGINGFFGGIGVASASAIAGVLTDLISWRAAFIIPGILCTLSGVALVVCWRLGLIADKRVDRAPAPATSRQEMWRAFIVLSLTMLCSGMVFTALSTVMPKLFAERLAGFVSGTSSIGLLVMAMYISTSATQLVGGRLSDRFSPKFVYIGMFAAQIPLLIVAAAVAGPALVPLMTAILLLGVLGTPAENVLLAHYSPSQHRSLAFGAKFVIALGIGPVAINLVAWVEQATGGFTMLFFILAGFAATLAVAALLLPSRRSAAQDAVAAAVPAE